MSQTSTCSSLASSVGVGVGSKLYYMAIGEPPLSKGFHCCTTVTKQFCRFYLHVSSLSLPPTPHQWKLQLSMLPFITVSFLVTGSFIHSHADTAKSLCEKLWGRRGLSVLQTGQAGVRALRWPTGNRQIRHPVWLTWICHTLLHTHIHKKALTDLLLPQYFLCHDYSHIGHHVMFNNNLSNMFLTLIITCVHAGAQ